MPVSHFDVDTEFSDWHSFAVALNCLKNLEYIDLNLEFCQELSCDMLTQMSQGLYKHPKMKGLKIKMNRHELGEDFTDELRTLLKNLPRLSELEFYASRNRFINDEGMERICDGIYALKELRKLTLNIDQCEGVGDRSLQLLRLALQENQFFRVLNLNMAVTSVTDEGVKCFAMMFKKVTHIHGLNLNFSVE